MDASRTDGAQRDHDASGIPSDASGIPSDAGGIPSDAGAAAVATRIGATWIVTLPRELSDATLASLRGDVVARLTRARAHAIVFEASGLDTIDATEFADLSTVARTAAWLGMRPMLVGLSAGIVAYLVNAGVDTSAFEPYGTLDDALATVAPAAGARATPDEPEATP